MISRFLKGGKNDSTGKGPNDTGKSKKGSKGVPDDIGEYVDYEEVDDD